MFSYKLFEQGSNLLLAVCDADILGKTIEGRDIEIEVSDFYKGDKCNEPQILKIAKKATIINAIGNRIVSLLVKNKIVDESSVLEIGSVLHAQVVSME